MPTRDIIKIENQSLIENQENENIRFNALKHLILNGTKLGVLCCISALTDAYIQNELTEKKFNTFSEFLKQSNVYLTWGLAAIGFSILTDKTAFHYVDDVIKDIKELFTGKKYLTNEEKLEAEIEQLNARIRKMEQAKIKQDEKNDYSQKLIEKLNDAIHKIKNNTIIYQKNIEYSINQTPKQTNEEVFDDY